jgi:hypothetical protein
LDLGYTYLSSFSLPKIAERFLEEVTLKTKKSSSSALVLDGHAIVYVAHVQARRIMSVFLGPSPSGLEPIMWMEPAPKLRAKRLASHLQTGRKDVSPWLSTHPSQWHKTLPELLRLAGVNTYGAASAPKHETLRSLGATPINYRAA